MTVRRSIGKMQEAKDTRIRRHNERNMYPHFSISSFNESFWFAWRLNPGLCWNLTELLSFVSLEDESLECDGCCSWSDELADTLLGANVIEATAEAAMASGPFKVNKCAHAELYFGRFSPVRPYADSISV